MAAPRKHPIIPLFWPQKPLLSTSFHTDARKGETPDLISSALQTFPAFNSVQHYTIAHNNGLPITPAHHGHTTHTDMAGQTHIIAPTFVRDLAGRTIHIGAGNIPPAQGSPLFPAHCTALPSTFSGQHFIENCFFTVPHPILNPHNKTPYKNRFNSLYPDGFRLPQTNRLYIKPEAKSDAAAHHFLTQWQQRPKGQNYQTFCAQNKADTWFEALFNQGATVIPTFEACNGYNIVNDNFELQDFHPGRAVQGLHEIVGQRQSDTPRGTILDVVQPGIATHTTAHLAKVIISDGSGYTRPPNIIRPDFTKPHTNLYLTEKTVKKFCLPTEPAHFTPPTLYNWTPKGFKQTSGPVWDPLHYTYASTPKIHRALKSPRVDNPYFSDIPEDMTLTFYPLASPNTQDIITSQNTLDRTPLAPKERLKTTHYHALSIQENTLPFIDHGTLNQSIRRAMGGQQAQADIHSLGAHIYDAYYDFRKTALAQRREWYRNTNRIKI